MRPAAIKHEAIIHVPEPRPFVRSTLHTLPHVLDGGSKWGKWDKWGKWGKWDKWGKSCDKWGKWDIRSTADSHSG